MSEAMQVIHTPSAPLAIVRDEADLGTMSDAEFERSLAKVETRKVRMGRILDSYLVEGGHYGNPQLANGRRAFQKPILYRAGADELAVGFGLEVLGDGDDVVESSAEFVSVTVRRAICDRVGRIIARTTASCNSKERRFKKFDGKGWTYDDAREVLNDIHAMAEKRAKVRLVVTALGLGAWLAAEEEMEAALDTDRPVSPWTEEEKREVYAAAVAKGITKRALAQLVQATLGRDRVGTGEDVQRVLAAIRAHERPARPVASDTTADGASSREPGEEAAA